MNELKRTGIDAAGAAESKKRVILSMGGKGGVGKTSVMAGLAEWFDSNQIPVKLLDLDTENKARGSRSWRSERGERVPSHKTFVRRLTERGYTRSRTVKARMISGLRLTEADRSAAIAVLSQRVRNGREMTADMTPACI